MLHAHLCRSSRRSVMKMIRVGLAIATQIAGGVGTADLVENDNLYAAMGLLRQ